MTPVLRYGDGLNVVSIALLLGSIAIGILASAAAANPVPAVVMVVVGLVAMMSPKIAQQWERAIVLRGATLADFWVNIVILAGMGLGLFSFCALRFRQKIA